MAMTSAQVSVGTTATALAQVTSPTEVTVKNTDGTAAVFLGGSGVTTSNGLSLAAGATLGLTVDGELFGIVATGTVTCHVLRRS